MLDKNGRHQQWQDRATRLANYKAQHKDRARKQGVEDKLAAARTLTQARKVLFGRKEKVIAANRGWIGHADFKNKKGCI